MVSGRRRKREWRVVLGAGKQEAAGSNGRTMPSTVPRSKLAFFLCTKRVCMCVCVDNVECNFVKNALSARVCVCVCGYECNCMFVFVANAVRPTAPTLDACAASPPPPPSKPTPSTPLPNTHTHSHTHTCAYINPYKSRAPYIRTQIHIHCSCIFSEDMHSFFSDADVDVAAAAFLYALTSFLLLSRSLTHMTPIRRVKKRGFKGPCNTLFSQNKYVTINQLIKLEWLTKW